MKKDCDNNNNNNNNNDNNNNNNNNDNDNDSDNEVVWELRSSGQLLFFYNGDGNHFPGN